MNDCVCELSGFCTLRNVALKPTLQTLCKRDKGRIDAMLSGEVYVSPWAKSKPNRQPRGSSRRACRECSTVGTVLRASIEAETGRRITCGTCAGYLKSLNTASSYSAEAITQKLYAEIEWPKPWREKHGDRDGQKRRIAEMVTAAIASAPAASCKPQRTPRASSTRKSNDQLYKKMLAAQKPARDPFTAEPVFHFGAHLWPIEGCWEAHVDTWNKLASQITGRCFVGISECGDCGTSPTADVIARLSDRFEVFTVPNTREGENPTFAELLKRIPQGENDVFLYAHGKGMKPATRISAAVKTWIQVMYQTVIFNHGEIVRRMAQGYKTFGSLRAFGKAPLSPEFSWHYAGTFFAVRAKYLRSAKPVKQGYGGVEAWPGNNFPANEAWCEFGDNRAITSHYSDKDMCNGVIEGAVRELSERNARRHCHRKLIAVTTCNLHGSAEIRNDIRVTLDSIAEHCASDVLVVDDGSPIEYQDYVKSLCRARGFLFVGVWNNGGISHAKNLCLSEFIEQPKYSHLIMLDDDVKVISDEFESTYTTAMERAGVGILSWHDPAYTGAAAEQDGELVASSKTCGVCVVVSRECVQATGFYKVMPGKWGREHSEYYQRAAAKFAKPGVYLDVPNSQTLLVLASNASVFTHEEKLASNEINRIYLGAEQ